MGAAHTGGGDVSRLERYPSSRTDFVLYNFLFLGQEFWSVGFGMTPLLLKRAASRPGSRRLARG